jgi:N-methylhydantoinase B
MNTPVEVIESEFPVRVERYELAVDSGGPGTFRGGLGVRRQWRILADESSVNLRMDRFKFSSAGIFGAKPAHPSKAMLNPGAATERALTSKVSGLRLRGGDLLSVEFAGGGWGDPFRRDVARVRDDVARGYVSFQSAQEDYGVVLTADFDVDVAATAQLRGQEIVPLNCASA